ncbi:MAG: IclR family transcriptional regulator, partial [Blastococcus sp.]
MLEELQEKTKETVSLAVLEGATIRFVDCVESLPSVRVGNRTGVVRPAHASAVGKVILAQLPISEVERRYPEEDISAGTPAALTDRRTLLRELDEVRAQGYALNWEESAEGLSAVAVALRTPAARRSPPWASRHRAAGWATSRRSGPSRPSCSRHPSGCRSGS